MTPEQRIEIARQEGPEFRSVSLSTSASGLRMDAHDIGPAVERTWNHDDYEFWVSVPGEALPAVVFALLKEKYSGRLGAVDEFKVFCEQHSIPHNWESWP